LQISHRTRELALFNLAIDSKHAIMRLGEAARGGSSVAAALVYLWARG
jgi:hypothetical protein